MSLSDLMRKSTEGWEEAWELDSQAGELQSRAATLRSESYWVSAVVRPMADAVASLLGADRVEVSGPFGLGSRVHVSFLGGEEKVGYLVLEPVGDRDRLFYDTWARTEKFAPGTIGELNGGNSVMAELPDDFAAIADVVRRLAAAE